MVNAARQPKPPELRVLRGVIPVVQTREGAGWSITCISIELYDDGFSVVFRLYGAGKPKNPDLALRVRDDRGNVYGVWGGGGTGEPTTTACHWRLSYDGVPRLDPASDELHIAVDEIRSTGYDSTGRPTGELVDAGSWTFSVKLARMAGDAPRSE